MFDTLRSFTAVGTEQSQRGSNNDQQCPQSGFFHAMLVLFWADAFAPQQMRNHHVGLEVSSTNPAPPSSQVSQGSNVVRCVCDLRHSMLIMTSCSAFLQCLVLLYGGRMVASDQQCQLPRGRVSTLVHDAPLHISQHHSLHLSQTPLGLAPFWGNMKRTH